MTRAVVYLALISVLTTAACARAKHDDTVSTLEIKKQEITAANYLSGANFCRTYATTTTKEIALSVQVPLSYTAPLKGSLNLYAYTLRPFDPKKPSFVFVDGGPGQNTHGTHEYFAGAMNEIHFDQRGLGCSAPETYELYKNADLYSSDNTIRDMEIIRKAYKISKWSVYGVSYGTVPATMYASVYSPATEAVVLEGVVGDLAALASDDYLADKLNLILTNLNQPQRDTFTALMKERSADTTSMLELLNKFFYYDRGQKTASDLLSKTLISPEGILDRLKLQSLSKSAADKDSGLPQRPFAIDQNISNILYCKNLGSGAVPDFKLTYSADRNFANVAADAGKVETLCSDIGVPDRSRQTYVPAKYKTSRPVYYFQGSHDGATIAKGAIEHWKTVPKGTSYFMLAQEGGHNPNLTRLGSDARDLRDAEAVLFHKALLAQSISNADMSTINTFNSDDQRWYLYLTPPTTVAANEDLQNHLAGIEMVRAARYSGVSSSTLDWEHLPEGAVSELLEKKDHFNSTEAKVIGALLTNVSARTGVPRSVIFGAINQESAFKGYGIIRDYGNYSCSIAQFNIATFCRAFAGQAADRERFSWPDGLSCDDLGDLNSKIMAPILRDASAEGSHQTGTTDFEVLSVNPLKVIPQMPGATYDQKRKFFEAGISFASSCNTNDTAMRVMAAALKGIYSDSIPDDLKDAHPHTAWLLADVIYNFGTAAVPLLETYGGPGIWQRLTPQVYIDTLAKILKTKPTRGLKLAYKDEDGNPATIGYFQICVSQRHMTSITNAALPIGMRDVAHAFVNDCEKLYPPAK